MSDNVIVGFGNNGNSSHYVVDNNSLAAQLGLMIGSVLGSSFITDDVTGGSLADPYLVPATSSAIGGSVTADYTTISTYDEAYRFVSSGWNHVKNIAAKVTGNDSILFISDLFVQNDLDFSGVNNDVELNVLNTKRSNILTGNGDDFVRVTSATNNPGWSNLHLISTGDGNDYVVVNKGDASLIPTTLVNFVDGRYTTVEANLGRGNDTYAANNDHIKTSDHVHGGTGSDKIFTGDGNDILYGDYDFGVISKNAPGDYDLVSKGDTLKGGAGHDEFHYSNGDGFGIVGDGFDHILDFATNDVLIMTTHSPGDVVTTENAVVHVDSIDLSGVMVLVNDVASVFLENYSGNTADIFV